MEVRETGENRFAPLQGGADVVSTPQETAVEYAGLVARRVHDRATPIRLAFIRGSRLDPPPMARLLRGGRGGAVRLKLYLAFLWFAAAPPHDVTYPARAWAGLLGLADFERGGARRVSDAIASLGDHRLVQLERRPGLPTRVLLCDEDGSGRAYRPPWEVVDELQAAGESPESPLLVPHYYVQLPVEFWTNGWAATLSGPAIVMLLAILSEAFGRPSFTEVWFSPATAAERFAVSEDTRTAGLRQLRDLEILDVRRRPVHKDAFDFRRMRNTYVLDPFRFSKRPGE